MSSCPRWRMARTIGALLVLVWVVLVDPQLLVPALASAALLPAALLDPARARAWLDSHAFVLSTVLVLSASPLTAVLGAAMCPVTALSLFLPTRLAPWHRCAVVSGTAALLIGWTHTDLDLVVLASMFAAFLSTRPLAALGEVLRELGLHNGPRDPMLAWSPLRPPRGVT